METRTRNFLLAVDEPYELYRSYHRGQLSAAPSRDIIGGECKQKREPARLSGGNQLRNCRSQAVLTGPCGGAIYQINRGEEAIPSAPDDGTSTAQHGLHMSESDQVSASEPARRRKWKATCVCHARDRRMGAKGWRRETEGGGGSAPTRDTRYRNQLSIGDCIASIVSSRVSSSSVANSPNGENADERTRWDRLGPYSPPSSVRNFRGALSRSRDENAEKCNNATALK